MNKLNSFTTYIKETDFSGMHDGALPGVFTADALGSMSPRKRKDDMKKENRRKAPDTTSLMQILDTINAEEPDMDEIELGDEDFEEFEDDDGLGDIDFEALILKSDDLDVENEEDDLEDLDFEGGDFDEHDLDKEFFNDEDKNFDEDDDEEEDALPDDVIDDIDDVTGKVANWWREDEAEDELEDDEFEEEQETQMGMTPPGPSGLQGRQSGPPKIDQARMVFQQLMGKPDITRSDIIAAFVQDIDVTESTAVSYYERLAKEAGLTGKQGNDAASEDQQRELETPTAPQIAQEEPPTEMEGELDTSDDPNRNGIIRTVDNAHLVYKRQSEDGSFEELWVYNTDSMQGELKVRRDILAGTDIPQNRTQSEDGSQEYTIQTLGNGQIVHITGLPN